MRKYFIALLTLAMVSCTPSYADNGGLTISSCKAVNKAALEIINDYRSGKTQYQVFHKLNAYPASYWNDSDAAKVFTQTIVIDLHTNIRKGYNDKAIMKVVNTSCENKLGMNI